MEDDQSTTLVEVAHRQRYADKTDQQCTCQDFTGLNHCICDDEERS